MNEKKLNELNLIFDRMKDIKRGEIGFYFDNLEFLMDLTSAYMSFRSNVSLGDRPNVFVPNINGDLITNLLIMTSPRALKTYQKLSLDNSISVIYEKEDVPDEKSVYSGGHLVYTFSNNYEYLSTLVHELMHASNINPHEHTLTPAVLTEFISIYYELCAKDTLPSLGIDNKNIDFMSRFRFEVRNEELQFLLPLLLKNKYGEISKENLLRLHEEKHYFDDIEDYKFDEMCESLYSYFLKAMLSNNEDVMKKARMEYMKAALLRLKYSLGIGLTFFARKNYEKKQVYNMNEELIDNPYINIYSFLEKYGIRFNQDFIEQAMSSMKTYYYEHKNNKTLM